MKGRRFSLELDSLHKYGPENDTFISLYPHRKAGVSFPLVVPLPVPHVNFLQHFISPMDVVSPAQGLRSGKKRQNVLNSCTRLNF